MAKRLTDASIKREKPDPIKRREIADGLLPGLYLVVQPQAAGATGDPKCSWAVRYRYRGKTRKLTLSPAYPALGLAEAREMARAALLAVKAGGDPAGEKRQQHAVAEDAERDLVRVVADKFLRRHVGDARWRPEIERMLVKEVLPAWGERRIQDITKRDVNELLDRLQDRGVTVMTNRVFSLIRRMMSWAVEREYIMDSPCRGLRPPVTETSRDRVLSDDELRWLWKAAAKLGWPFGPIVHLLVLTGQRKSEVGDAVWSEFNLSARQWTIPAQRAKNKRAHDVALSATVIDILSELPRIASASAGGYLFTTTGETPVSGFSRAKKNIDKSMLEMARSEAAERGDDPEKIAIRAWTFHDLRRTAATGMARLGIIQPVVEKVLNHVSGSFRGIVGVYQRHEYAEEKRQALDAWARFVETIVSGSQAGNVIAMMRAAGR